MTRLCIALAAFCCTLGAQGHRAADLGRAALNAGLDEQQCFRVRDLQFTEEDAQFYLTDGYLIFGKRVNGGPISAVFTADVDGGDAEVLLLPPDRSERKTLATYTGSPNLNEHIQQAIFLFTDKTASAMLDQIRSNGMKPAPDIGKLLAEKWSQTVQNILTSFESRIVLDLLTPGQAGHGFFAALITGRKLGNFDLLRDDRSYEQMMAGQVASRNGLNYWDTWTSFVAAGHRGNPVYAAEEQIISYKMQAEVDAQLTLRSVTRIHIRTTEESRDVIPFDLSGQMRATSAKIDGQPVEVYERDSVRNGIIQNSGNELVLLIPNTPLAPGSEHDIEVTHEGKVVVDAGNKVYFVSARGSWYPNRGLQFAHYDATFRYPANLDLVTAGEVKETHTEGGVRTTRRVANGPVRILGFNLGEYEHRVVDRNGLRVEVFANRGVEQALKQAPLPTPLPLPAMRPRRGLPVDPDSLAAAPLPAVKPASSLDRVGGEIASALEFFRARFGEPPLKQVEVSPVPGRFGQGYAGMIYLSTLAYFAPESRQIASLSEPARIFYTDLMRAHEAAHQWWGNVVTSASYHHEWLMEALANYSGLLYLESSRGRKVVDAMLDEYRRELLTKAPDGEPTESAGPLVQGRRLESSANPNAWTAIVYGKGTWVIHMLRRRMGDAQFLAMLKDFRNEYEWKPLDTEAFRAVAARHLPPGSKDPKLEAFFDTWIYGTGIPTLKLAYSVRGRKLTGTVTQSDVSEDFTVTVPVEIQVGRGKPTVVQVRTGPEPVPFSVSIAGPNAKAVLDPGGSVLHR